jgi:hypothetical protein
MARRSASRGRLQTSCSHGWCRRGRQGSVRSGDGRGLSGRVPGAEREDPSWTQMTSGGADWAMVLWEGGEHLGRCSWEEDGEWLSCSRRPSMRPPSRRPLALSLLACLPTCPCPPRASSVPFCPSECLSRAALLVVEPCAWVGATAQFTRGRRFKTINSVRGKASRSLHVCVQHAVGVL